MNGLFCKGRPILLMGISDGDFGTGIWQDLKDGMGGVRSEVID